MNDPKKQSGRRSFPEVLVLHAGEDPSDPETREKAGVRTGVFGLACNLALFGFKLAAALFSSSLSILADALNNLSDAVSSLVALIGFKVSSQAPDREHPYGHGRAEYAAGILVAFLIVIMGFELLRSSIEKIASPEEAVMKTATLVILLASVLVKGIMAFFYRRTGKLIQSETVRAESLDSLCDMAATLVVLICLVIGHAAHILIDGWAGLAVSLFIIWEGIQSLRATMQPLLGTPSDPEERKTIKTLVLQDPRILGVHDIMIHDYGPELQMVSLHAELPADTDFQTAHEAVDAAEKRIEEALPCSAVIHMDPVALQDSETMTLKSEIHNMAHRISRKYSSTGSPDEVTIHDFRVVHSRDSTTLIFDVLVPFDMPADKVRKAFEDMIRTMTGSYRCSIHIDHPL